MLNIYYSITCHAQKYMRFYFKIFVYTYGAINTVDSHVLKLIIEN